jgi:hypothetical protein
MPSELNELLKKYDELRRQRKEAWNKIPKKAIFYEMAPIEYDNHKSAYDAMIDKAVEIAEYLIVNKESK